MPKITKENFVEAGKLRDRASAAQEASRAAFDLLREAFERSDNQESPQFQQLNADHNRKLQHLAEITEEQRKWWAALGKS